MYIIHRYKESVCVFYRVNTVRLQWMCVPVTHAQMEEPASVTNRQGDSGSTYTHTHTHTGSTLHTHIQTHTGPTLYTHS